MALSADQRAMLQLLLERGQSYGDLASLLDVDEAEVRSRARAALTELGGADPDRSVGVTDWILGQADPIGRADAVRHLKEDPADHALAATLISRLPEIAPQAQLPKLLAEPRGGGFLRRGTPVRPEREPAPPPPAGGEAATAGGPGLSIPTPRTSLSPSQVRLIMILVLGALILVPVVLAVSGALGGSDENTATPSTNASTTPNNTGGLEIQRVTLRPAAGGDASGEAVFGIANRQQAYLDLSIRRLEPPPEGKVYVAWLMLGPVAGHPLTPLRVNPDGTFDDRIPIDNFLLDLASRTRFVDVSLTPTKELTSRIQQAANQGNPVIQYTGESVLRGAVPRAGGQQGSTG